MPKGSGVLNGTGRERSEWFELLDEWGAPGRPYAEIAAWLRDEHSLSKWWAQKIIVEYEQDRGLRAPGIRRDGTFEVGTSKTIGVPVGQLFDAFVDTRQRKKWLTDGTMSLRASQQDQSASFDWEDGATRVSAQFTDKGPRSSVAVSHQKLGAADAQATKEKWKERLTQLKTRLEA